MGGTEGGGGLVGNLTDHPKCRSAKTLRIRKGKVSVFVLGLWVFFFGGGGGYDFNNPGFQGFGSKAVMIVQ